MSEEILRSILAAVNALNAVEVRGKNNLLNLGGAIDVLEGVAGQLQKEMQERGDPDDGTVSAP